MNKVEIQKLLRRAIAIAGSQRALALACGYTQHGIWYAYTKGRVTGELARRIHDALDGAVADHELRPDLYQKRVTR